MLGAIFNPQNGVTTFRVWAPNAKQIDVVGDFNGWQPNKNMLSKCEDGFWEGTINNLTAGEKYKYVLLNEKAKLRIDPATRDTLDSRTNNVDNYGTITTIEMSKHDFKSPDFSNLIIYQCHVGSFCGRNDNMHRNNWTSNFVDVKEKLQHIKYLGFNVIEFLPVQEFQGDRSWGYNPSFYYALESAYGLPSELKELVRCCHESGLAVIFDVVYNHISNVHSSFWEFDDAVNEPNGIYLSNFETPWGLAPAFWKQEVKDFFFENMKMYFDEFSADGIRFDATRYIEKNTGLGNDGWKFMQELTYRSKEGYPSKYLIAEHIGDHDSIINSAGFHATWTKTPYECVIEALNKNDSINNIKKVVGTNLGFGQNYKYPWNLIKYLLGSHDECGDMNNGNNNHRYYIEHFGGRDNWYAKAKTRVAWVLNIAMQGTPMMFMGNECNMSGYWHDSEDSNGDHRYDWNLTRDLNGLAMMQLVKDANQVRWNHPSLRSVNLQVTHEDHNNDIIAFKRWNNDGDVTLVVINANDSNFHDNSYGIQTEQPGQWSQILCSQDLKYGGWDGAGNAYHEPLTQSDGKIYVNIPKWSVLIFHLK
jgi:1,4-alpha-glucan branching enzyme